MKKVEKLPILISIPHGGENIPLEVLSKVELSKDEILYDIDIYSQEIYDFSNIVEYTISSDIARTFIDLNRNINDLPPENPDGVVKTLNCNNKEIYKENLTSEEIVILLAKYYEPYHNKIKEICMSNKIKFAFDCHTMAEVGPDVSINPGTSRPLFCISNNLGKSCSDKYLIKLQKIIAKVFEININEVSLNSPFKGGYITQQWGSNPLPWIQIEINRKLYLEKDKKTIAKKDILYLNSRMEEVIKTFYSSCL